VVGCPIHISLDYMARNVLIFNLCFVFDPVVKTARYELVLKKVANYLKALEVFLLLTFCSLNMQFVIILSVNKMSQKFTAGFNEAIHKCRTGSWWYVWLVFKLVGTCIADVLLTL